MDRDETIALFLQGTEAWNTWAEKMLAEKKALEEVGKWRAANDVFGRTYPMSNEAHVWLGTAKADFSESTFTGLEKGVRGSLPLRELIFPGETAFNNSRFLGHWWFDGIRFLSTVSFHNCTFERHANFGGINFAAEAFFGEATFEDGATFSNATFIGRALFLRTKFLRFSNFTDANFKNVAAFREAVFEDDCMFDHAHFEGRTFFVDVKFMKLATFASANFGSSTSFNSTNFTSAEKPAIFTGIKADREIDLSGCAFASVPAFNRADFKQAPDLDDVKFPLPAFWRAGKAKLIPQYRAIRRMAIQSADYEREQMAFKGEIRCKRGTEHKPYYTAFWFGLAYDALSDFGRSIAQPLAIWFASVIAFATFYFWNAGVGPAEWFSLCAGDGISKALKAITLSAANALPLIGSSRGEVAGTFYKCLALDGHVPAWSPIIQIGQTLWSAALIFLFLLALRNQFKIK
jgi:uncharacterized protein YjbI with pentapeptide repeats